MRWVAASAVAAITIYLLGRCTFYAMFTGFRPYDDEGAMLSVLLELTRGHVLYDQVAAMYGPVGFFPKVAVIKLFHLTVDHNLSRSITWLLYFAGCITAGAATWRMTRQISSFILSSFATYFLLRWLGGESGHPQDQCQLLLALSALIATFTEGRFARKAYLTLAVIGGLLAMTKGNLGLFFLVAFGSSLVFLMKKSRVRLVLKVTCVITLITLPYILLRPHIETTSVFRFFIATECALVSCILIANTRTKAGTIPASNLVVYLGLFAATVACIFVGTLMTGTSLHGMEEGLIWLPLRSSNLFFFLWRQTNLMIPIGAAALLMSVISTSYLRNPRINDSGPYLVTALLRTCAGLIVAKIALYDATIGQEVLMEVTPQLIWLFLMPLNKRDKLAECSFARLFIAFLAATETLQSYPNAGTQQAMGLVLPVCIGIISLYDGLHSLAAMVRHRLFGALRTTLYATMAVGALWYCQLHLSDRAEAYRSLVPLDLPGSNMIHVPSEELHHLQTVINTLKANADVFMTLPGMNSFYFWTQMRPPTLSNVTTWMLLTDEQQRANFNALKAANKPCVLYDQEMASFWNHEVPTASKAPIVQLVKKNYRVAISESSWALLVPNDRESVTRVDDQSKRTTIRLPPFPPASRVEAGSK